MSEALFAGKPSDYLVVEDPDKPSTWHLPVKRNGKPDRRLAGAAWAALHKGYRGNTYQGPNKSEAIAKLKRLYSSQGWELPSAAASNEYEPDLAEVAQFAIGERIPSQTYPGYVLRKGKIFEAGDYPDKNFAITPEEVLAALDDFEVVPIDVEHRPTLFDGKLGNLFHVESHDEGRTVDGTIAIPQWLDDVIGSGPVKVSTQWDTANKTLEKLALVVDPRVSDAAMLSSFANSVGLAGSRHSQADMADLQIIHDLASKQGATCLTNQADMHANHIAKEKKMTLAEKVKSWFTALPEEEKEGITLEELSQLGASASPPPTASQAQTSADFAAAEIANLKAQVAQFAADRRQQEATNFVDALIRDARLLPAQREVAIFKLALDMADDERSPEKATFAKSDGTSVQFSRAEVTKAFMTALPQHSLLMRTPISELPQGSMVLSGGASSQKTPYDEGVEIGRKYAEANGNNHPTAHSNGK